MFWFIKKKLVNVVDDVLCCNGFENNKIKKYYTLKKIILIKFFFDGKIMENKNKIEQELEDSAMQKLNWQQIYRKI